MQLIKGICMVLGLVGGALGGQFLKPAYGTTSLMFTPEELSQDAYQAREQVRRPGILRCEGIIYGNKTGQVWLNGRCYTAGETYCCQDSKQTIRIHQITPETVKVSWFYKGKEHRVTLKPNQSYHARLQKVLT